MSIDVNVASIFDSVIAMAASAPAFTALIASFVIVSWLESRRPFFFRRNEPDGRLFTNFGLGLINAGIQLMVPVSVIIAATWARQHGIGLLNQWHFGFAIMALGTVSVYSLATYWTHRLSHRVPLLWRMHHIHHADTHIDLSTGFRNHPAELVFIIITLIAVAILSGLSPQILIAYQIVAACFSLWSHADFELPARVDRRLRLVIVTPAMHHVHHSADQEQTDSNYGEVFSFWDRAFGSYCHMTADQLRAMRIGLGDRHDSAAANLMGQLAAPLRA